MTAKEEESVRCCQEFNKMKKEKCLLDLLFQNDGQGKPERSGLRNEGGRKDIEMVNINSS